MSSALVGWDMEVDSTDLWCENSLLHDPTISHGPSHHGTHSLYRGTRPVCPAVLGDVVVLLPPGNVAVAVHLGPGETSAFPGIRPQVRVVVPPNAKCLRIF